MFLVLFLSVFVIPTRAQTKLAQYKNMHYHGNICTTNRTSPIHNGHTYSTRFTDPRMSARHQCEASTWRYEAHFATVVRGCCRSCRCRSDAPEVVAAGMGACLSSSSSSMLLLLLLLSIRGCRDSERMADNTQKLQATISAAVESWQTGFNSLIFSMFDFFLGQRMFNPLRSVLYGAALSGLAISAPQRY